MGKKKFSWAIFIWIAGIIAVVVGVNWCSKNPDWRISRFLGVSSSDSVSTLIAAFAFIWLLIVGFSAKVLRKSKAETFIKNLSEIKTDAKVVYKNSGTQSQDEFMTRTGLSIVQTFSITFETTDKKRLVFQVTQERYSQILENDVGILTYKQNGDLLCFVDFQRQA